MPTAAQRLIQRETRANQPAATDVVAGTLFNVEDEGNIVEQSDGTNWEPFGGAGSGALVILTADPGSPTNDTFWVRRTGVSPAMQVEVRVRIAGVTYTLAGITI